MTWPPRSRVRSAVYHETGDVRISPASEWAPAINDFSTQHPQQPCGPLIGQNACHGEFPSSTRNRFYLLDTRSCEDEKKQPINIRTLESCSSSSVCWFPRELAISTQQAAHPRRPFLDFKGKTGRQNMTPPPAHNSSATALLKDNKPG